MCYVLSAWSHLETALSSNQRLTTAGLTTWEVSSMASDKRIKVTLACSECKQRNYNTMKNKKNDPDRLEMNKYCRFCKKHTSHKETK